MDEERRWLREVRDSALGRMTEPWHLRVLEATANRRPYLIGAMCTTTFTDPDRLEWRDPDDPPLERDRCPACQGAMLRGGATA